MKCWLIGIACSREPALRAQLICCLLVILSACQTPVQTGSPEARLSGQALSRTIAQREASIIARQSFAFRGGLGIWSDEQSIPARIGWQQQGAILDIDLEGPAGIGTMQLQDDGKQARLTRGNTVLATGNSADRVLQQGLGLAAPVPVTQLAYWVRGLPGDAGTIRRDEQGKLLSLSFTDARATVWQVRFRRYAPWDGIDMPALITASGGGWSVRVVLKNWRFPTTTVVPETRESNNRLPIPGR